MSDPIPFPDRGVTPERPSQEELIISGFELLRAKESDFVIIKTPQTAAEVGPAANAVLVAIQKYCARNNLKGISVCLLPAGLELTVMSEEQMSAMGWKKASLLELATKMPPLAGRRN